MQMEKKQLFKAAGKYKKWLENITLNPFAYTVNGRNYHLVIYHRKSPQDLTGYAIVSLEKGPKEEYRKALLPLTLFSGASTNIFNIMGARSKILPIYYRGVIEAIQSSDLAGDKTMNAGKEAFEKLLEIQIPFNKLYKEYEDYYDNQVLTNKIITDEDIDYTITVLSKLDLMQFRQGLILSEHGGIMPEFLQKLDRIKNKLPYESVKFIQGFKSNRDIIDDRLSDFGFEREIMDLTQEEQIELKKEDTRRSAENLILEREKLLRGPAAL